MVSKFGGLAALVVLSALTIQSLPGVAAEPPEVKILRETPLPDFPGKEATMIEVRTKPKKYGLVISYTNIKSEEEAISALRLPYQETIEFLS